MSCRAFGIGVMQKSGQERHACGLMSPVCLACLDWMELPLQSTSQRWASSWYTAAVAHGPGPFHPWHHLRRTWRVRSGTESQHRIRIRGFRDANPAAVVLPAVKSQEHRILMSGTLATRT